MIKAAGYCRVSTDKDDQANSFESQKAYFRHYIQAHPDWELYEIYADEGITGTSTKRRNAFNQMMLSFTAKYNQQLEVLEKRLEEAIQRQENRQDMASLRSRIQAQVCAILKGETQSEAFYKTLLHSLRVFKDRHLELRLN